MALAEPQQDDHAYYDTPDRIEGKWYDMHKGQLLWLTAWGLLGAAIIFIPENFWLKLPGIVMIGLAMYGSWWGDDGPGYVKLMDRHDSRTQRKRTGGYIEPETSGETPAEAKEVQKVSKVLFNLGLLGIPFDTAPGEPEELFPTGAVVDYRNKLLAFYFATHGWDSHSLDFPERFAREQDMVDVLSKAVSQVDVEHEKVSVSFINGSRPWSPIPTIAKLYYELHDDFIKTAPGTMETRLADNLDTHLRKLAAVAATHINMIVVTTRLPKSWLRDDLTTIDVEEAAISLIKEALLQGLESVGVHQPRCLDLLELDEFIQMQWNIANSGELHQQLFDRRQKLRYGLLSVEEVTEQLLASNPFPQGLKRMGKDYFYLDGTYFRVYRNRKFGKKKLRPGGLLGLFMNRESPWVMNSFCGDVVSAQAEMQRMTRAIVYARGWRRHKDNSGRYYSQAELEEQERTERQQNAIHVAGVPVFKFNHFVTVGATSKKDLRKYSRKTLASAAMLLIWLKPVQLHSRQLRAFASALLGVNNL